MWGTTSSYVANYAWSAVQSLAANPDDAAKFVGTDIYFQLTMMLQKWGTDDKH